MPVRYSSELASGFGSPDGVNAVLAPSTKPPGVSPSTKPGGVPPHGPDVPSTRTQSVGAPVTVSIAPVELTNAPRPAAYPGPFSGRAPRSLIKPTTSASCTVVVTVSAPTAVATLTSRTRNGCTLEGTAQVS